MGAALAVDFYARTNSVDGWPQRKFLNEAKYIPTAFTDPSKQWKKQHSFEQISGTLDSAIGVDQQPKSEQAFRTLTGVIEVEQGEEILAKRKKIGALIDLFVGENSVFAPNTVSMGVADTAKKLIDLLPLSPVLPKVEGDGEGAMMLLWNLSGVNLLAVVEDQRLHVAINATSQRAIYHSDLPFEGIRIPKELMEQLPG